MGFASYNVVPPPPTGLFSPLKFDLSNSILVEFQQPEFEGYGSKPSKSVSKDTSNKVRESLDAPLIEELVSDEKKTVFPTVAKIEFAHYNYHQKERVVSGNNYTRVNYNYFAKKAHPSAHRNMVPRAVLMKIGLRPLNTARPVNTAHHPFTGRERVVSRNNYTRVNYNYSAKKAHLSAHRNIVPRAVLMKIGLRPLNTARPVNTAHHPFNEKRPKNISQDVNIVGPRINTASTNDNTGSLNINI
ncbi:hypothetical protein Tco_0036181, partial [Tanacetum coccineum]